MNSKKNKKTKKALLLSLLLILSSVVVLVGSTFAWFTDSAKSGKNKITAGNLDVDIEYARFGAMRDESGKILESEWTTLTEDMSIFKSIDDTLWEPGHTEIAYLRIKNNGTLALKYDFLIDTYGSADSLTPEKEYTNVNGEKFKLSNYLVLNQTASTTENLNRTSYWINDDINTPENEETAHMGSLKTSASGIVLAPGESRDLTLAIYMPTSVGNEANQLPAKVATEGNPVLYFGITVKAIQAESESDSFGNTYDNTAE